MDISRRPLAQTLLAFAGLDDQRLQEMDPDQLESRIQLALLVWNAVLLADGEAAEARDRGGDGEDAFESVIAGLIRDVRESLGPAHHDLETLIRYLVMRKLELHGGDDRAIAEVHVDRDGRGRARVITTGL